MIRSVARLVNPLVLRIAGRRHMPVAGIIHHRGRNTGRLYATPLGIRPATASAEDDDRPPRRSLLTRPARVIISVSTSRPPGRAVG